MQMQRQLQYLEVSEKDVKDAVDCGQGGIHLLSSGRRNQHQFLKYFFNLMRNHNLEADFHRLLTATAWRSVSAKCQIETSLPWKSNSGIWFPQTVRKPFLHNHKKKLYIFLICEFPRCSMTNNFEIVKWEKWMNIARTRISIINIQFLTNR